MLCSVGTCYLELLHDVQCCYMLRRVITCCAVLLHVTKIITCCAVLLHVTKSYYMLRSVGTCPLELLHDVLCCYMSPRVIT